MTSLASWLGADETGMTHLHVFWGGLFVEQLLASADLLRFWLLGNGGKGPSCLLVTLGGRILALLGPSLA